MLIRPAVGRLALSPLASVRSQLITRASNAPILLRPHFRGFVSQTKGGHTGRSAMGRSVEPLAVTWLAPKPSEVTPDHIIPDLPILPATSHRQNDVLVFLVTPAFAPWVDESHSFLKESIRHIFQDAHGPACVREDFHTVVAVIDKIPSPQGHLVAKEEKHIGGSGNGSEGLSMLLVGKKHLARKVAPKSPAERGSTPLEPVVTYSVKSRPGRDIPLISHDVEFRLANTLFVNGKHRTIFASSWGHDRSTDDLVLEQELDLSGFQIRSTSDPRVELQLPLHPVTKRRKVLFSMGNILRQISKSDGSDEPIPASTELEKELPRYVKENNLMDQRLVVWALIEPATSVCDPNREMNGSRVPRSIRNGARLHRVVSGGGGWGKKQGLLSLDPENRFATDFSSTTGDVLAETSSQNGNEDSLGDNSFPSGFPGFGGESEITSINKVAEDGEFVQFFVAPEGGSVESILGELEQQSVLEGAPILASTFGAISTPEYGIPNAGDSLSSPSDNSSPVISLKNYFGVLSEKGITYSSSVTEETGSPDEAQKDVKKVSGTKIGVPGARVHFV
ncbi:hypothetical protein FQN54_009157 [Arachnomyces sp. PD_36]|nr:hypothetical protein FQN54_009157 [Arachnomyces sp. PD_36]